MHRHTNNQYLPGLILERRLSLIFLVEAVKSSFFCLIISKSSLICVKSIYFIKLHICVMDTYQMTNVDFHRCKYIHEYIISKPAKCNLLFCYMYVQMKEREKERERLNIIVYISLIFSHHNYWLPGFQ